MGYRNLTRVLIFFDFHSTVRAALSDQVRGCIWPPTPLRSQFTVYDLSIAEPSFSVIVMDTCVP